MTTQEYIDSGILELYAAGGLSQAESAEVERMAGEHPEVRVALEECLRAMEAYALIHAQAPRPELEDQIIHQIQSLSGAEASEQTAVTPGKGTQIPFSPAPNVEDRSFDRWWQLAASVLLLISVAGNVYLYNQVSTTRQELTGLKASNRQYALQVNQLEQKSLVSENQLGLLRNPQTLAIRLKGTPQHTQAQATVFWNQETKEVYFDPSSLPAAPTGKQYQLWALAKGKPVDAGVVQAVDSSLQRMKQIEEAQAFAVTLEPAGGSVNPTLTEMYVMGEASR